MPEVADEEEARGDCRGQEDDVKEESIDRSKVVAMGDEARMRSALEKILKLADATEYGVIEKADGSEADLIRECGGDPSTNVWLEGEVLRLAKEGLGIAS